MQLSQWNRFRNDTFKDRRDDELPFIPGQAPAAEGGVAVKAPQTPTKLDSARAEAGPQRQHDAGRWHLLQAHGCATADGW